jgi:hypothetical protein
MSFGPTNATNAAMNNLGGVSNQAFANNKAATDAGSGLLATGEQNTQSGTNFFNTMLNGNQANTTALLQPNIDQIKNAQQNTLQATSTLMPRGGGRSGTLFAAPYQANQNIQNLFNQTRGGAASTLGQLGLAQQGLGANLFGVGNQALGAATGANTANLTAAQNQQQYTNSMYAALGQGLFNLATTPFGSAGSSLFGRFTGGG